MPKSSLELDLHVIDKWANVTQKEYIEGELWAEVATWSMGRMGRDQQHLKGSKKKKEPMKEP